MSYPANIFTTEESMELERLAQMTEPAAFHSWCAANAERIAKAVKAWTAFEELLKRSCIGEMQWWNQPGQFALKLSNAQGLNGFDLEGIDPDEEWYGDTLAECVQNAVADVLAAEEAEA